MGILNITPDSFFAESRLRTDDLTQIKERAARLLAEGADILDVGGYSTRPGAVQVDPEAELERVIPVIALLAGAFPETPISIDTFRADVATAAVAAGAHIVNDVSGGTLDPEMFSAVAALQVPYVLMHMRGTPATMNTLTEYNEVTADVMTELREKIFRLRQMGVSDVIVDPGFGFAKTPEQNFSLVADLEIFHTLDCPILLGVSRKSTIVKTLGTTAENALNGTTVLNTLALMAGVQILRVHDPKAAREAILLTEKVKKIKL